MRHASVQVRGLLTKSEWDRYHALMEVGHYLESQNRYDLVYTVQKEIDTLILPAIERLKEKGRDRDRMTEEYLRSKDRIADENDVDDEDDGENDGEDGEDDDKGNDADSKRK